MTIYFRLNYERISKAQAVKLFGKDLLKYYINEAWKGFMADPNECQMWQTSHGLFEVGFDL